MTTCKMCKGEIAGDEYFMVVARVDGQSKKAILCRACREANARDIAARGWLVYMTEAMRLEATQYLDKEAEGRYAIEDALEALGDPGANA